MGFDSLGVGYFSATRSNLIASTAGERQARRRAQKQRIREGREGEGRDVGVGISVVSLSRERELKVGGGAKGGRRKEERDEAGELEGVGGERVSFTKLISQRAPFRGRRRFSSRVL